MTAAQQSRGEDATGLLQRMGGQELATKVAGSSKQVDTGVLWLPMGL